MHFDENSLELVKQLLEAIAVYASLGIKALEQKAKYLPAARLLLEQMKGKTQKLIENSEQGIYSTYAHDSIFPQFP